MILQSGCKVGSYAVFALVLLIVVAPQILPFDIGDEPVNSGELVSLTCSVTKGDLPVKITWLHDNRSVETDQGVSVTKVNKKVSTLSVDSVEASHAGIYTCSAKNAAGSAMHSTVLNVNGTSFCFLPHVLSHSLLLSIHPEILDTWFRELFELASLDWQPIPNSSAPANPSLRIRRRSVERRRHGLGHLYREQGRLASEHHLDPKREASLQNSRDNRAADQQAHQPAQHRVHPSRSYGGLLLYRFKFSRNASPYRIFKC